MPRLSWIFRLTACLVSGLILSLAFPQGFWGASYGPVVWIALLPMIGALWTVSGKRAKWKGFGLGWVMGAVFSVINVWWLSTVAPIAPWALGLYLAFYYGAFGAFAATWGNPNRVAATGWKSDLRIAFSNAAFWGGMEWLRGWVITGFGWSGLGVALHGSLKMAQAADLLGITGLSVLVIFIQLLVVLSVLCNLRGDTLGATARRGIALAVAGLMFGYGFWRISSAAKGESIPLKVLLVQANIPQEGPNFRIEPEAVDMAYEKVTSEGLEPLKDTSRFPDWVIWPESALPGRLLTGEDAKWGMWPETVNVLNQIHTYGDFTLLMGMTELEGVPQDGGLVQKQGGKGWNSLVVLDSEKNLQSFRKNHLVIFGETIPFVDTIPWLKKIYEQQSGMEYGGSFTEGISFEPLTSEIQGTKVGIIPSICFEDTVPRLERKFVRPGPQIIVNVTNDGWFQQSEAADQHFENALFRAIELRRPMIRCANTGISGTITPIGETTMLKDENGNHFVAGSMLAKVDIPKEPLFSLYAIVGDWPIIGMGLLGWGLGFWNRKPRGASDVDNQADADLPSRSTDG